MIWSKFPYDMVPAIWSIKYGPFHTVHFIWSIFYSSYGQCHHFYLRFLGSHCYTDYVSNWSDVVCSIWAIISAYIAIVPNASHNIERLLAAFNSIAPTWSIGVSGAFWVSLENCQGSEKFPRNPDWDDRQESTYLNNFFQFLLPKDRQTLDLVSLNQHAFLAIICLVDLLITNSRIRIKDLIPAWLFATAYAVNTILVWLIFGKFRFPPT